MATLPDLVGRLRLDLSEMDRAQGEATRRGAAIGSALGSAVGNLAGGALAAAGQKVSQFVSGSVDEYATLQDAISVTGVKFGDQAVSVEKFAQGAAKSFGMSNSAALDAANTFGTFGKAAELTGAPLADFSTQMAGLAGDMASFSGTTPDEAVTALGAAFRGEYDPIERYGVLINKEMVNQKALKMGLAATKDEITKGDEVMATRQLVLEQTGQAQGDFARTGDSVANSQKRVAAETANSQAALGEKLAPAYLAVLKAVGPVVDAVTKFVEVTITVVQKIWEWKDAIAAVLIVIGVLNAQTIAANVAMAAWLVQNALIRAATTAWTAVQWLLNAALTANPIGLVVAAIAALVAGIIVAYNHSETFRKIVDGLFAKLKEFFEWCGPAIEEWAVKVGTSLAQAVTDVENFVNGLVTWFTKMKTSLEQAGTDIGNWGTKMKNSLVQAEEDMDTFGDHVNALPGKVAAGLATFAQILWDSIVAGWNRARDESKLAIDAVVQSATDIVDRIGSALIGFAAQLFQWVAGAFQALPEPVRVAITNVITFVQGMAVDIKNALVNLPTEMIQMGKDVINGLLDGLQQLGPQVVSYLTNLIPEPVRKALSISSPSGMMDEIGQQTMQGLDEGLQKWMPQIRSTLETIIQIVNQVKSALRISSPSAVMLDMGDMTGEGFHKGLEAWIPRIQALLDQVNTMVQQAQQKAQQAQAAATSATQGIRAEDNSVVNPHFYDEVNVGGKTYKKGQPGYAGAAARWGVPGYKLSDFVKAEDGTLVPKSFYEPKGNAPNKLGSLTNLPGGSLYPSGLFDAIENASAKLGKLVMAEDGTLVPASFYENVAAAPIKASKTVLAEDGSWVPASFYDKVGIPTGANLLKMANSLKDKLVSGPGGKWGVDVSNVGKTVADILYQMGFRGDPTDKREAMYAPSNFGQTLAAAAQQAGITIDARSFGTQLKPQDVADAIKWASKIGGLVSA